MWGGVVGVEGGWCVEIKASPVPRKVPCYFNHPHLFCLLCLALAVSQIKGEGKGFGAQVFYNKAFQQGVSKR